MQVAILIVAGACLIAWAIIATISLCAAKSHLKQARVSSSAFSSSSMRTDNSPYIAESRYHLIVEDDDDDFEELQEGSSSFAVLPEDTKGVSFQLESPCIGLPNMVPGPVYRNRIAVLLPVYNMSEAAMHLLSSWAERCGPGISLDVFMVENGSTSHSLPPDKDLQQYVAAVQEQATKSHQIGHVRLHVLRMPTNVQTAHGFQLAYTAARAVAFNEKFEFEAYWLWITSQWIPPVSSHTPRDIVSPLLTALRGDDGLGAVVPALHPAPKNFWGVFGAMLRDDAYANAKDPKQQLKPALFTDILGMMIRGPLMTQILQFGFPATSLRAWGIDVDICETIRSAGFNLAVHQGVTLQKRHWIGYKMNRMSENIDDRVKKSLKESQFFLRKKYGKGFQKRLPFVKSQREGLPAGLKKQRRMRNGHKEKW